MPLPRRDLERTRERLRPWLAARLPAARDVAVSPLHGPGDTGFSNDTLMFDLSWREGGREWHRELVLRLEPSGVAVFPEYDLGLQFRILRALAATDVPVPAALWQEPSGAVLGAPFYVMERVRGSIPGDHPSYHAEGWMTRISAAERAAVWWSGVETLARIHALGEEMRGLLPRPAGGASPLEAQLRYWRRFLAWATGGARHAVAEEGLAWLEAHSPPTPEPAAPCWGDARLGNMIFRDGRCVAVLDWEMATLGNPAQDVAWWLFFDEHHSAGAGVPRLEGMPGREETLAFYTARAGAPPQHLEYYDVFAAFRFSAIMIRVAEGLTQAGILPPGSDLGRENAATRILAGRLERMGASRAAAG